MKIFSIFVIIGVILLPVGAYPDATISGTVTIDGRTDYSDALVFVSGTGLYAKTSSDGSYSIPNVPSGTYAVYATIPGCLAGADTNVVISSAPITLNFQLLPGDINLDGRIDLLDALELTKVWGAIPTSPDWDFSLDIFRDGIIDFLDIQLMVQYWNSSSHYPDEVVIDENTELPEDNPDLIDVIVEGDTIYYIYQSGAILPEFTPGDIIVGETGEGYLRKVISATVSGDTIILLTEQASLDEAVRKVSIDTTFSLAPTKKMTLDPIDIDSTYIGTDGKEYRIKLQSKGGLVSPSLKGELFEIRRDSVVINLWNDSNLVFCLMVDTIVLEKSIDIDLELDIGWGGIDTFRLVGSSTDNLNFIGVSMNLNSSFSDTIQKKLATVPLGSITIPAGPVPIIFVFELGVYAGIEVDFNISISSEIANTVGVTSIATLGVEYAKDVGWNPICNWTLDGNADLNFTPSTDLDASLIDYLKASIGAKLYGVLGPTFYAKPYQYNEVSYPPFDYELGVGLGAGVGFETGILSWIIPEYNHTFIDERLCLLHHIQAYWREQKDASGTYYSISGNYYDPDPDSGYPWIALSSYGIQGASACWGFHGLNEADVETLVIWIYSFDNGIDFFDGEHYHVWDYDNDEWVYWGSSDKIERWHGWYVQGEAVQKYIRDSTNAVSLRVRSNLFDHSHIKYVACEELGESYGKLTTKETQFASERLMIPALEIPIESKKAVPIKKGMDY